MKTFKKILSEVAQPKSAEEKRFKDQHEIQIIDPLGLGDQEFYKPKKMPVKRLADYVKDQDSAAYDRSYSEKDKQFKMPRNIDEDASEEIPMMAKQLHFIKYAADEIMDYLEMGIDPEEWFQNKLAAAHNELKSLHAYIEGDKRYMQNMMPDNDDDLEDLLAASYYESLDEGVKAGMLKLKDGSSVNVSSKDAKLLDDMLSNLNTKNRKEMERVMMLDKAGYNEILGFAKEAL